MQQKSAHIILLLLDVLAVLVLVYFISELVSISKSIAERSEVVEVQTRFGFYMLSIFVPLVHLLGFLKLSNNRKTLVNRAVVVLFLIVLAFGVFFDRVLVSIFEKNGYTNCNNHIEVGTFSDFMQYTPNEKCIN